FSRDWSSDVCSSDLEGPTISAYPGYGILAEDVPGDGEQGPSILYNDALANPGAHLRFEIVSLPLHGTFEWDELGRVSYIGDGTRSEERRVGEGSRSR